MKYTILKVVVSIVAVGVFLGNSWWCLFISDKNPGLLITWWTILSFTLVFGGGSALFFISDKEWENRHD